MLSWCWHHCYSLCVANITQQKLSYGWGSARCRIHLARFLGTPSECPACTGFCGLRQSQMLLPGREREGSGQKQLPAARLGQDSALSLHAATCYVLAAETGTGTWLFLYPTASSDRKQANNQNWVLDYSAFRKTWWSLLLLFLPSNCLQHRFLLKQRAVMHLL